MKAQQKSLRKSLPKKADNVTKRKMSTKAKKVVKTKKVVKMPKRFGSTAVDAQGRPLPVDYNTHGLHDPYDYFYHDTSKVFDDHAHADAMRVRFPTRDALEAARAIQNDLINSQIDPLAAKITDKKEKEAFEQTLLAVLRPSEVLSKEEVVYRLEQKGFPRVEFVTETTENSWNQFLFNDFKAGRVSTKQKFETVAHWAFMLSSTAFLAYLGVDACTQYFYDLEYPMHHH